MSGFRKFRTTLHRRRRSVEALELGHWREMEEGPPVAGPGTPGTAVRAPVLEADSESAPLEFSPSLEARQIGPAPIAWLKSRRSGEDH